MSHPAYSLLMALLVSGAVASPGNRAGRDRAYAAIYVFLTCIVSIVGGAWFMYLVHR
jgi:hypothetical protein